VSSHLSSSSWENSLRRTCAKDTNDVGKVQPSEEYFFFFFIELKRNHLKPKTWTTGKNGRSSL
jgi:hypothetical protein